MKIVIRIINVILGIALLLLFMTMIDKNEYSQTIGVSPLFFGEFIFATIIIGSIIFWGVMLLSTINKSFKKPFILIVLSLTSFYIAYENYPTIRQQKIFPKILELESAINNLNETTDAYIKENAYDYYKYRLEELKMFKDMYTNQYDFLAHSNKINDKRANRLSLFLCIVGITLIVNAAYTYKVAKNE